MAEESKFAIKRSGIPSQEISDSLKSSEEYGLEVGNFIQSEWMYRENTSTSLFYSRKDLWDELRAYMEGKQSVYRYKDRFKQDGDLSYLNLNWDIVPILPKFVDLIRNGIQNRLYSIKAEAQDPSSTAEKRRKLQVLKAEMDKKDQLLALENATGVPQFENNPETLPEDDDEMSVYAQIKLKPGIEIAAETGINYILESNEYNREIKRRVDDDLIALNAGCVKHSFHPNEGIVLEYVDPIDVVHSPTDDPSHKDVYYYGEVKRIPISRVREQYPHLSEDQLEKVRSAGSSWNEYNNLEHSELGNSEEDRDQNLVYLLFFCWKTTKNNVFKVKENGKGGETAIRKDDSFIIPEGDEASYSKVNKIEEVVYEGVQVLGAGNLLLKWELQKNMVKRKSSTTNVMMPYIFIKPKAAFNGEDSVISRARPFADLYQLSHLKLQQILQRITPSGVFIDLDGLANVDLGDGNNYDAQSALDLYFKTGSVVGRSITVDGDNNPGRIPIQELPGGQGHQVGVIINAMNYYLQQLQFVTGINEARDASNLDERAAVGVQKLQAANSNVATRHILEASLDIVRKTADAVSIRLADLIEYWPLKDSLIQSIGRSNVQILEDISKYHLSEFGIFLEVGPDEEEKAHFEANIQQALAKDQIYLEDVMDLRGINNMKLAAEYFKVKRKAKAKADRTQVEHNQQVQTESNTAAVQASAEAKMAELQAEYAEKSKLAQLESELHLARLDKEKESQKDLMTYEYELSMGKMGAASYNDEMARTHQGQIDIEREKVKGFESSGYDTKPNNTLADKTFKQS